MLSAFVNSLNFALKVGYYFKQMNLISLSLITFLFSLLSYQANAEVFSYGRDASVIGFTQAYSVKDNESLIEIARKFDLGYNEIVNANPDLDPFVPGTDVSVNIPSLWILPEADSGNEIVVNISEMRLYYFFKQKNNSMVKTFPIGIGSEGNDTPLGIFRIIEKVVRPSWHVPESIRKERPELPSVVPPGPENPLGSHALRLSSKSILIHGTDKPWAVGRRATHGCLRLYPEDIPNLFNLVPKGTKVTIVRQPVKAGVKNGKVYLEVHKDDDINENYLHNAVGLLKRKNLLKDVVTEKLYNAINMKRGVPVEISN